MKCQKVELLISAHLDGEVTVSEWQEVEAHIESCGGCAAKLHAFQQTTDVFKRDLPEHEPSQHVWSQIAKRIEALDKPSRATRLLDWLRAASDRLIIRQSAPVRVAQAGLVLAGIIFLVFTRLPYKLDAPLTPSAVELPAMDKPAEIPSDPEYDPTEEKQRLLQASIIEQVQNYLEKAGVLLLEVKNSDSDADVDEVAAIRSSSEDLLEQTILMKQNLKESKLVVLGNIVQQLELILSDVANLDDAPDSDEIESLKATILQNDLLIKIEIYDVRKLEQNRDETKAGSAFNRKQQLQKI
ncbi:zf-HC2 domain-containing protein [bacterium]|nr:zf-HC2 domain-containing protein [bacterium]